MSLALRVTGNGTVVTLGGITTGYFSRDLHFITRLTAKSSMQTQFTPLERWEMAVFASYQVKVINRYDPSTKRCQEVPIPPPLMPPPLTPLTQWLTKTSTSLRVAINNHESRRNISRSHYNCLTPWNVRVSTKNIIRSFYDRNSMSLSITAAVKGTDAWVMEWGSVAE